MKKTYVMPLLVLTVICLVVSGALAVMNSITLPVVTSAAAERAEEEMYRKIPEATGFEQIELETIEGLPDTIKEAYKTTNNVGYIFIAAIHGFSGDITIICSLDEEGTIIATSTLSHTETKGIGTIIEQKSFLNTFKGKDNRLEGVDTVAGATISTRAYIHAIRDIIEAFYIIIGENV